LRSSLNPYVIDQIPPLAEFEQWLVQLSIVGAHQVWRHSGSSLQKPFILELVAEMRQLMLKQLAAEWTAILDGQRQFLSDESPETIHRFLCQLSSYSANDMLMSSLLFQVGGHLRSGTPGSHLRPLHKSSYNNRANNNNISSSRRSRTTDEYCRQ
jgi:hypothetical protein